MKGQRIVVLLISCFIGSSVAQSNFDLSSILQVFAEKARARFECGFKLLNIPVLDPFHLAAYSVFLTNIDIAQNVNATILKAEVAGLRNFQLSDVSASLLAGSLSFNVLHPQLVIKGQHVTSGSYSGQHFAGAGSVNIVVKNVRVTPTITFSLFPTLQMTSHKAAVSIESAQATFTGFGSSKIDQQTSNVLSMGSPKWIAANQDFLNTEIIKVFTGLFNGISQQLPSIASVVTAMIAYNPEKGCSQ